MAYPSLNDLSIQFQSAGTVAVIVEGEDTAGDAWVLGKKWFRHRATQVRFYPQDGWDLVVDAVTTLREECPDVPIFGIIDRDCTPDEELDWLVPFGVYRLQRYSVENYLLDPVCWHRVFYDAVDAFGGLPDHWSEPEDVQRIIDDCFKSLIPATAFNRVVAGVKRINQDYEKAPKAIQDPRDSRLAQLDSVLADWAALNRHQEDLKVALAGELARMERCSSDQLTAMVNGKLVVQELRLRFQQEISLEAPRDYVDWLQEYLARCPDPPDEPRQLLERILAAARGDNV